MNQHNRGLALACNITFYDSINMTKATAKRHFSKAKCDC